MENSSPNTHNTNVQLHLEFSRLKNNNNCVIEHLIEVSPPDYSALENNYQLALNNAKLLQDRCQLLEHLLRSVEVSPMSNIIEEYKSMSTFYLRQLVKEIEIYRASADERSKLLDFLAYLRSVTREVEELLIIDGTER